MKTNIFLLLLVVLIAILTVNINNADKTPPKFADSYSISGILKMPYPRISEPVDSYYDMRNKKSRIDYYHGLTKTYQRPDIPPYGKNFKVVHATTEHSTNELQCITIEGSFLHSIIPRGLIPDLSKFVLASDNVTCGDAECEQWVQTVTHNKLVTKQIFLVSKTGEPVQFLVDGSDKYEYDYFNYTPGNQDPSLFEVDKSNGDLEAFVYEYLTCNPIVNPVAVDLHYHNPTMELIDNNDTHIHNMFEEFKAKHGKKYESDLEHDMRKNIFKQNVRYIHSSNRAGENYKLTVNLFADLTRDELIRSRGRLHTDKEDTGGILFNKTQFSRQTELPNSVDWRVKGAVTPVKDQAMCSSSWSFGVVGAIEGAFFLMTGQLVSLSEQVLMDCSWGYGNYGCDGGLDFRAYQWIMKHGGIPTSESYGPYLAEDGLCHLDNITKTATIENYVRIPQNDVDALKSAIAFYGPVTVSIDASSTNFQFYSNGVLHDRSCGRPSSQLNHIALAVGYGILNAEPYWLIKNSWSDFWGDGGYIMLSQTNNNCGVTSAATFVVLEGEAGTITTASSTSASTSALQSTIPSTYSPRTSPGSAASTRQCFNWWSAILAISSVFVYFGYSSNS